MHDNPRPHTDRLVVNLLETQAIERMEWPPCSSDSKPIEHAWDTLRRRIAARAFSPLCARESEIALLEE